MPRIAWVRLRADGAGLLRHLFQLVEQVRLRTGAPVPARHWRDRDGRHDVHGIDGRRVQGVVSGARPRAAGAAGDGVAAGVAVERVAADAARQYVVAGPRVEAV